MIIAAPDKIASYRTLKAELILAEIVKDVREADLVLVEGYKQAGYPSVEVLRSEAGKELIGTPEQRFAVAADFSVKVEVPWFDLGDATGICDLIERKFLGGS